MNSGKSQIYPTVTRDGTLYFQAVREAGYGKADIYRSRLLDGVYQTPESIGPVINSENYEGDVFIADDESYLIVSISSRKDGFGEGDISVSVTSMTHGRLGRIWAAQSIRTNAIFARWSHPTESTSF